MKKTLYLIFTEEGYTETKDTLIEASAALWINPNILDAKQLDMLEKAGIEPHILEQWVTPSDEKTIHNIIKQIEQRHDNIDLLVEYL